MVIQTEEAVANGCSSTTRMMEEFKLEPVRVKTFDELYAEVCSDLRRANKSIDLCEKIKAVHSELKRVQLLLLYCPNVVRKFTNCIGDHYEGKCESKSRDLLASAKILSPNDFHQAIEILTSALLLCPWRHSCRESSEEEIKDFILTKAVDQACIKWLVSVILNLEPTSTTFELKDNDTDKKKGNGRTEDQLVHSNKFVHKCDATDDKKNVELIDESGKSESSSDNNMTLPIAKDTMGRSRSRKTYNESSTDSSDCVSVDLLGEIYFDRSERFSQRGDHESTILDFVRAIICSGANNKKVTFTRAAMVGASLKAMDHLEEATSVFHHALQLLRNDPHADNRTKSMETISIVKALKEIKAKTGDITTGIKASTKVLNQVQPRPKPVVVEDYPSTPLEKHFPETVLLPCQEERVLFDIFGSPSNNPILLAASDAIEMRYDEKRGRHAVAKRTIPPGATLMVDPPYSWSLYPQAYKRCCQHCCKEVVSGIPCQYCSSVVFCKWDCWQRSEHYHKFECPILKGLDSSEALGEMAPLCYRTVCKTDLSVLQYYISQVESDEGEIGGEDESDIVFMANNSERNKIYLGLNSASQLDPVNFSSVFGLTTNTQQRPAGDIIKRTLVVIYLTLCLRYTGYFSSSSASRANTRDEKEPIASSKDASMKTQQYSVPLFDEELKQEELSRSELYTAAFMLRLSQSLSCNAYGLNHVSPNQGMHASSRQMHTIQQFGGACYPTVSIINHSCNPNIFRFTYGNICIVRSIQEIQQGEEILDSYGPLFATQSLISRRKLLLSQYFFQCKCQACEGDWPLFKDLSSAKVSSISEETIYKCPGCGGRNIMTMGMKKGGNNGKCSNCGQKFDWRKVSGALIESERKYLDEKESLISSGKLNENGERVFTHHLSILAKFLTSPHKLIIESQETLKLAWYISVLQKKMKA